MAGREQVDDLPVPLYLADGDGPAWAGKNNGSGIGYPFLIQVRGARGRWDLYIDGELFPYHVDADAVVPIVRGGMPGVKVTLLAGQVQINHRPFVGEENPDAWDAPERPRWPDPAAVARWASDARARFQGKRGTSPDGLHGLASLAQVQYLRGCWQLIIDGAMFPYLLGPDAVVPVRAGEVPTVEITMLAQRVQLDLGADLAMPHPAAWDTSTDPAPSS